MAGEKTDMSALLRRAAFGGSAEERTEQLRKRQEEKSKKPTDMNDWLRTQLGRNVITRNDEEGEN